MSVPTTIAVIAPDDAARRRRNVVLAWVHVALALAFLAGFFWMQGR